MGQHAFNINFHWLFQNSFIIQWPEKGKDPRQSGRYPSYSCFQSCTPSGVVNEYHRGDHVLVRVMPDVPIMVMEILHIWRETKKALGETGGSVRLKLYSRPEDTSSGRNHHHGEVFTVPAFCLASLC